ncbi:unnamed protein product [Rotaria sp. Silwood2]|nr:unnamed protein product [Rotaria sp. Silwood2]
MTSTQNTKTIISTVECYDAWSNTYDSDGNILQLLDDAAFDEIARPLLNSVNQHSTTQICCELGCGTGRNTTKMLNAGWSVHRIEHRQYLDDYYCFCGRDNVNAYLQTAS